MRVNDFDANERMWKERARAKEKERAKQRVVFIFVCARIDEKRIRT